MENHSAVLMAVAGIQKYIFASNRLKENLGASYLVSNLFGELINQVYTKPKKNNETLEYDGYIGGGNALLFFDNNTDAQNFVMELTRTALVYSPGISIISAIGQIDIDKDKYSYSRSELFKQLSINKARYISQINIPRHGLSAECTSDGNSLDVWSEAEKQYLSASTNAKIEAFDKAKDIMNNEFETELKEEYCFTNLLDELGQSKGSENHIAIVHIDGNSIGKRFSALNSLEETRSLSKEIEQAVKNSFRVLLNKIIEEIKKEKLTEYLQIKKSGNKTILPLRPIIMGGDDITFVCDGRMGIYYAKIFMEAFEQQNNLEKDPLKLSSCAGIAIIKTKYPFYRGYLIAEELCANAKRQRAKLDDTGSWLDFHVAQGGFSGSLNEIRNIQCRSKSKNLLSRPYKVGKVEAADNDFSTLVSDTIKLKKDWPNNKIKQLREILSLDEGAAGIFVKEMEARGLVLPNEKYKSTLFDEHKTPYYDMIELLEYYPKYELEGGIK